MRSLTRLFNALATLADSVLSLACVLDGASNRLRHQLAEGSDAAPILEHQPAGEDAEGETVPAAKGRRKAS